MMPLARATADVSCTLLEADFSGIEAVLTGYGQRHLSSVNAFNYIRTARMGVHALVAARALGTPADVAWPDDRLKAYLTEIKHANTLVYDTSKRTVHMVNFGGTPYGMCEKFPSMFPTVRAAEKFINYYYDVAPSLKDQQSELRRHAREAGFLGGPEQPGRPSHWDHPYGYRHWFWDVLSYQPCDEFTARKWLGDPLRASRIVQMHGRWFKTRPGNDWNRVVAFYPQSIAAGRLKEAERRLFLPWSPDYIGDCYFGRTPLLAPIHDSLLLHVPNRILDRVVEVVCRVMQEPSAYLPVPADWGLGEYLPIGISAKAGKNWAPRIADGAHANLGGMSEIAVPKWMYVPHAGADDPVLPVEDKDDEEWRMLQRSVA